MAGTAPGGRPADAWSSPTEAQGVASRRGRIGQEEALAAGAFAVEEPPEEPFDDPPELPPLLADDDEEEDDEPESPPEDPPDDESDLPPLPLVSESEPAERESVR
ncbi:hypothetical protein GA0074692_4379 [Micromonospora pallida]|uniref:Uncharacterized protein n=1 Tax=Micromonospora pallida TaxID=145854 RepID=A0A1C6T481_9ACTN|nr:hypothetical protein GA0074692_4379 [Micromonospora pallida]